MKHAQVSSASMGKFDRVAPNEATNLNKKRQKVAPMRTPGEEKEKYLKAATRLLSGEGGIDKAKVANVGVTDGANSGKRGKGGGKGGQSKRRSKQGGKQGKRRK